MEEKAGKNKIGKDKVYCIILKKNPFLFICTYKKKGFERPGYYISEGIAAVQKYDWYGYYGREKNKNVSYVEKLAGDYQFEFSQHHDLVRREKFHKSTLN